MNIRMFYCIDCFIGTAVFVFLWILIFSSCSNKIVDNNSRNNNNSKYVYRQKILSQVPYHQGEKWGYMSRDGIVTMEPRYEETSFYYLVKDNYSEDKKSRVYLARVKENGKYGFIDDKGILIIPYQYEQISDFSSSVAFVSRNDKFIYSIDNRGAKTKPRASCGGSYSSSHCFDYFRSNGKLYFEMNVERWRDTINGEIIYKRSCDTITTEWDAILDNGGCYAAVRNNKKWGVVNKELELVTPFLYDSVRVNLWTRGIRYFIVESNGKFGFLNNEGVEIIKPQYHKVSFFKENRLSLVWIDDDFSGYIDELGRVYFKK